MDEREIRTQAKVLILYLLSNIGEPVEFTTMNDMVLGDGLVNYFDFADAFSDLLEKNQICQIGRNEQDDPLYTVTEEGRSVLDSYEGEMLSDVRDRARRHAMQVLAFRNKGVKQTSRITETEDGWTLCCTIEDKQKILFQTQVFLTDRRYAEQLQKNFDDRSDIIFRGAMSLLSGDVNFIFDD